MRRRRPVGFSRRISDGLGCASGGGIGLGAWGPLWGLPQGLFGECRGSTGAQAVGICSGAPVDQRSASPAGRASRMAGDWRQGSLGESEVWSEVWSQVWRVGSSSLEPAGPSAAIHAPRGFALVFWLVSGWSLLGLSSLSAVSSPPIGPRLPASSRQRHRLPGARPTACCTAAVAAATAAVVIESPSPRPPDPELRLLRHAPGRRPLTLRCSKSADPCMPGRAPLASFSSQRQMQLQRALQRPDVFPMWSRCIRCFWLDSHKLSLKLKPQSSPL